MTAWRHAAMALMALVTAGCRDDSVLAPQGPGAAQITELAWTLFALAALIFAIVLTAVWLAMHGPPGIRSRLAERDTVVAGGIVFPAVTLTGLLVYCVWLMQADVRASNGEVERIDVVGEQWWWRISHAAPDGRRFAGANEIRIPVGRTVEFTLTSADVIHSFWIPSLGGKVDMIPGRSTKLRVASDRLGVFRGPCAEYCGGPHALMTAIVIALPPAEFEAWRTREAAPAKEPAADIEQRGQSLFLAAGCGACHMVRGTPADGMIGPDLTHVGARRSVAVETLPMSVANLARFITDGQHVKPGNTMPPFRVFSAEERDAIAAYLVSLR
jgi:cytochrome c oxidase subunit II